MIKQLMGKYIIVNFYFIFKDVSDMFLTCFAWFTRCTAQIWGNS